MPKDLTIGLLLREKRVLTCPTEPFLHRTPARTRLEPHNVEPPQRVCVGLSRRAVPLFSLSVFLSRIMAPLLLLFFMLAPAPALASKGVDVSELTSLQAFQCLFSSGYTFAVGLLLASSDSHSL